MLLQNLVLIPGASLLNKGRKINKQTNQPKAKASGINRYKKAKWLEMLSKALKKKVFQPPLALCAKQYHITPTQSRASVFHILSNTAGRTKNQACNVMQEKIEQQPHSNPREVGAFPYFLTTHTYFMTLYTTITKFYILTHQIWTFKISAAVRTGKKNKSSSKAADL